MSKRAAVLGATLAVALPVSAVAEAAPGCDRRCNTITVRTSDRTPASGQTFRIWGRFVDSGKPAAGRLVKVQTRRDGRWVPIRGARLRATETGRYRMRLILSQRGRRTMRVVGVDRGPGPNARNRFVVRVH